jgi:WD40 repeat protein
MASLVNNSISLFSSRSSSALISGGADGWIKLWDVTQSVLSGEPLSAIQAHAGVIWYIALSGHGHLLVSAGQDGTVKLWEIPSGQLLATMRDHDDLFWGVAVSHAAYCRPRSDDHTVDCFKARCQGGQGGQGG